MLDPSVCGDAECTDPDKLADGDGVRCHGCQSVYHFVCAGISESTQRKKGYKAKEAWRCAQRCRKPTPEQFSDDDDGAQALALASIKDPDLKTIFSFLTSKMSQFEKTCKFVCDRYDELLEKNKALDEKLKAVVKEKDEEIRELKATINENNQYERKNNIEIYGLEVKDEEDVYALVTKTVQCYDKDFVADSIGYAHRLPSKNKGRPPSIVAVLKSRREKVAILEKARNAAKAKKKTLQQSIIPSTLNPTNAVTITDNISGYYKNLLWLAKERAAEKNYKYVWYQNCRILVRKNEGDKKVIRIKDEKEVEKII